MVVDCTCAATRSSFVASTIVHLASVEMLGAFDRNVAIRLVNINRVFKALIDLLGQPDLLFWHELVGQALRLGALSSLLRLGANHLLGGYCALSRCHAALLLTSLGLLTFLVVNVHVVI